MKFVVEYQRLAEEYRKLSDTVAGRKDKDALELMARAWARIATERENRLNSQAVREPLDHVRLNEADTERQGHYHGPGRSLFHSVSVMHQRTFIARLNIEHYRQKLLTEQDGTTRQRIVQLLTEEEARLGALNDPSGKNNENHKY